MVALYINELKMKVNQASFKLRASLVNSDALWGRIISQNTKYKER